MKYFSQFTQLPFLDELSTLNRLNGNTVMLQELYQNAMRDLALHLDRFDASIDRGDSKALLFAVQHIRNCAASIAATQLQFEAEQLENLLQNHQPLRSGMAEGFLRQGLHTLESLAHSLRVL